MSNQTQPTHTPGPWQTIPFEWDQGSFKVETVARGNDVPDQGYPIATAYSLEDATPIAAAPDLLAVAKNLMACMDAEPEVYHPAFIASTRAALAKAKG